MEDSLGSWIDPAALKRLQQAFVDRPEGTDDDPAIGSLIDTPEAADAGTTTRVRPSGEQLDRFDALLERFGESAPPPAPEPTDELGEAQREAVLGAVRLASQETGAVECFLVRRRGEEPSDGEAATSWESFETLYATPGADASIEAALPLAQAWENGLRRLGTQAQSALHVELGGHRQLAIVPLAVEQRAFCLGLVIHQELESERAATIRAALTDALTR